MARRDPATWSSRTIRPDWIGAAQRPALHDHRPPRGAEEGLFVKVLLVTPAHNEASRIANTIASVVGQRLRPTRWIIVDDGSTDETRAVAERAAFPHHFIEVHSSTRSNVFARGLDSASESHAFSDAVRSVALDDFDAVGKLDADIVLPDSYYSEIAEVMRADPQIGICGGRLREAASVGTRLIAIPNHHVHGALKLYSRECFERIGGIRGVLGWDTIDEAMARRAGYRTRSVDNVVAWHDRPWGTREGALKGKVLFGRAAYVSHYPAEWVVGRSLKSGLQWPFALLGIAEIAGYFGAAAMRLERYPDEGVRRFIRSEIRTRELALVRRLASSMLPWHE